MNTINLIALSVYLLITGPQAAAQSHPNGKVGGEWTFSRPELIEAGRNIERFGGRQHDALIEATAFQLLEVIRYSCTNCVIEGTTVYVGDEFWFEVKGDPWVIEIIAEALDRSTLEDPKIKELFQKLIWENARKINLKPQPRIGGGHIHFDIKSHFGNDRLLFRNFVVDLFNHPELFMGALSMDYLNAPPLAILSGEQRDIFEVLLREFDRGTMSISEFRTRINSDVYYYTYMNEFYHPSANPWKYQALNLVHKDSIEIRGSRPQESFEHFLALVRLFQNRINYLKNFDGPIEYIRKDYSRLVSAKTVKDKQFYKNDFPARQVLDVYREYVESTGLNWEDYQKLTTRELTKQHKKEAARNSTDSDILIRTCRKLFQ